MRNENKKSDSNNRHGTNKEHNINNRHSANKEYVTDKEYIANKENTPRVERDKSLIEGRHAVPEAIRAGRNIERLYIQDGAHDGAIETVKREAFKRGIQVRYVSKARLDYMSQTQRHQGVIAECPSYVYAGIDDMLCLAESKNEKPFLFLADGIEDPHNLGAIIRTANACGAHGVIITKDRCASVTPTAERASAGAASHTLVARVTNISETVKILKEKGLWFVCADTEGEEMYSLDLSGAIGLVLGNEGKGVKPLVKKNCDMTARIPMYGDTESLNVSVAAGVLAYEVIRQRRFPH